MLVDVSCGQRNEATSGSSSSLTLLRLSSMKSTNEADGCRKCRPGSYGAGGVLLKLGRSQVDHFRTGLRFPKMGHVDSKFALALTHAALKLLVPGFPWDTISAVGCLGQQVQPYSK